MEAFWNHHVTLGELIWMFIGWQLMNLAGAFFKDFSERRREGKRAP